MNKKYFLKKTLALFALLSLSLFQSAARLYKIVFAKRTIMFVTNQKIRSINFGPLSQLCIILSLACIANLFYESLYYDKIISAKNEEITKLQSVNNYFQEEFNDVNDKLKKINDYLVSVGGINHKVNGEEKPEFKTPKNIKEDDLSNDDQHTLNEIKQTKYVLADIHSFTRNRIKTIEDAIAITGLNLRRNLPKTPNKKLSEFSSEKEISLNGKKGITNRQGGPLVALDSIIDNTSAEDELEKQLQKAEFSDNLDRLTMLEKLVNVMPFSRPMKNFYISSGFGSRHDPITGGYAIHQGLDFVGPTHAKVISPSNGKVILAGGFSDYGNAVVIDHGFGITTRYGHLASVAVSVGQVVKKGQVIAFQGNTGRSTGSHLHYEVRYRNAPLNPKKFLEAGDLLFKDESAVKYVNS